MLCPVQETYKLPHRLIEKKRRDRINECIAQLKDLLPEHLKLTVSSRWRWRDNMVNLDLRAAACTIEWLLAAITSLRPECVSKSVNEKLEGWGCLLSASD